MQRLRTVSGFQAALLNAAPPPGRGVATGTPFLSLVEISKTYGETRANRAISFDIGRGEIVGLVGANGAGKSTLIQSISGLVKPDSGYLRFGADPRPVEELDRRTAQDRGIRTVFQELSLSPNLTVAENFLVEYSAQSTRSWRADMRRIAQKSIAAIFPDARIDLDRPVAELPLAEQQVVEIARAASDPRLQMLVLDEPTSSLDVRQSEQLRNYLLARADEGVSFIYVTHKLKEIFALTRRIVVLRNGALAWSGRTADSSMTHLLTEMGAAESAAKPRRPDGRRGSAAGEIVMRLPASLTQGEPVSLHKGEVVGLAGLEGNGQSPLLRAILRDVRGGGGMTATGKKLTAAFVTGNRANEGILPGLSLLRNAMATAVGDRSLLSLLSPGEAPRKAGPFLAALGVPEQRFETPIVEMSGGNQQKALMVRPLVVGADIVLLDDPTRGVDVQTKQQIYALIHQMAAAGRTIVWYSSEDIEFHQCDRVLVLHDHQIAAEFAGDAIDEQAILDASFAHIGDDTRRGHKGGSRRAGQAAIAALPFVSLLIVYGVIVALNPTAASGFGLSILLSNAVNLVFIALGQMFIVGGAQIDLGAGTFAALVSVLAATLLPHSAILGIAAIGLLVSAYAALGVAIVMNRLPALVVTLGASFVWLGIGHTVLPTPGGASPPWLAALFSFSVPFIPTAVVLILLPAALCFLVVRSRLGVILRGFGRNARAMEQSGWSKLRMQGVRYLLAAALIAVGGLAMTGLNGAADANSGSSLTLLSIATVVIGGCPLIGGVMRPFSVAAGAVTLTLIGTLLGSLGVSTDFTAAIQGGILLLLLLVQVLERRVVQ